MTGLEHLYLDNTRVGDAGVAHLTGLTRLQSLYLANTRVTDAGLAQLRGAGFRSDQRIGLSLVRAGDIARLALCILVHIAIARDTTYSWFRRGNIARIGR